MGTLTRFGVCMDAELLAAFDHWAGRQGFANRSDALRELARSALLPNDNASPQASMTLLIWYWSGTANAPDPQQLARLEQDFQRLILGQGCWQVAAGGIHLWICQASSVWSDVVAKWNQQPDHCQLRLINPADYSGNSAAV
ncbi:MAG: putative nickel-responsive regulator [Phycisphaerae bacterium]|nr:putative nickel-responsive regulator [Phycisphaerae bacterium]